MTSLEIMSDDYGGDEQIDDEGLDAPVHVHQDIADHHHRGLVVIPGGVQGLEETFEN